MLGRRCDPGLSAMARSTGSSSRAQRPPILRSPAPSVPDGHGPLVRGRRGLDPIGTEGGAAVLVLSRRTRDSIMIGHEIVVTVLSIGRDQVRLGIEAPPDVEVHREEVYRSIQEANRAAAASAGDVTQLVEVATGTKDERRSRGSTVSDPSAPGAPMTGGRGARPDDPGTAPGRGASPLVPRPPSPPTTAQAREPEAHASEARAPEDQVPGARHAERLPAPDSGTATS